MLPGHKRPLSFALWPLPWWSFPFSSPEPQMWNWYKVHCMKDTKRKSSVPCSRDRSFHLMLRIDPNYSCSESIVFRSEFFKILYNFIRQQAIDWKLCDNLHWIVSLDYVRVRCANFVSKASPSSFLLSFLPRSLPAPPPTPTTRHAPTPTHH